MLSRSAFIALWLTASACGGSASTPPSPVPVPQPGTLALSGRVTDGDTHAAVIGASVTILDGKDANTSTVTDNGGSFRFDGLSIGGFTVRVREQGYDSAFQSVTLVADTSIAMSMKSDKTALSGTWTGTLSFTAPNIGHQDLAVAQAPMVQNSDTVSAIADAGVYQTLFNGTLRGTPAIGTTTAIAGTLTFIENLAGHPPSVCRGSSDFTGTVNWTQMTIGAAQIATDCGFTVTGATLSLVRPQ